MSVPVAVWILRALCLGLLAALIGGCVWAQSTGGLWAGLIAIIAQPWGAVTMLDLYVGLGAVAAWMCWLEPRRGLLVLWLGLMLLFGNMSTLAFLLRRTWGATSLRAVFLPTGR